MTQVLVVFESMFGNTRAVAEAVVSGLPAGCTASVVEVSSAPPQVDETVDLLVVGGPTHAFSMSRPQTRQSATEQMTGPPVSRGGGVREWLASARLRPGLAVTAFDTRVRRPRVPGSAARAIARRLRRLGGRQVADTRTFWVHGTPGPLYDGELDRARAWAADLGTAVEGLPDIGAARHLGHKGRGRSVSP